MVKRPVVHLIDGPVYVFRAYYAMPPMSAPDGAPTHAAYGYTNSLIRYLTEFAPTHLAVAFDASMESFRNQLYPEYKAQRGEVPEDLEPQWGFCTDATEALGIPALEAPGYEADDVIGTLATRLADRGCRVVVASTDKDLAQLVREDGSVTLFDPSRQAALDADDVRQRFGVDPEQIPDYLGIVGDTVDNLPGVPGVGPKGAAAALSAFGRIEDVPADPRAWGGVETRGVKRLARLLDEHRERALRTRQLATLVRDVPGLRADLRSLAWRGADAARIERLFGELGWNRIAQRIPRFA